MIAIVERDKWILDAAAAVIADAEDADAQMTYQRPEEGLPSGYLLVSVEELRETIVRRFTQHAEEEIARLHRELSEAHDDVEQAREGAANVARTGCRLCRHAPCICPKAPPYK